MKKKYLFKLLVIAFVLGLMVMNLTACNSDLYYDTDTLYSSEWIEVGESSSYAEVVQLDTSVLDYVHVSYTSGIFRLIPIDGDPYVEYAITKRGKNDDNAKIVISKSAGECEIKFKNAGIFEGNCEYYINLYVPKNAIKNMKLENTNGNAYMEGMTLENLVVGTQSGDIVMNDVTAKEVTLSATSGNITFKGTVPNLIIDVTSGNVKARTSVMPTSLLCDITSGYVNLLFPDSEDGYTLFFTRTSGYIVSDFGNEKFWSLLLKAGRVKYRNKEGLYYVDITSGKLEMEKVNN